MSSATGRAARDAGLSFEAWVNEQHARAGQRGALVHVWHNQAVTEVVHGRVIYKGSGVADYTGILFGGMYLAAEAKSTDKERLPRNVITPLQQAHLTAVTSAGGLAFLLVEFRDDAERVRYAIPWHQVPWKTLRTAETLDPMDIPDVFRVTNDDYLAMYHKGSDNRFIIGAATERKRVHPRE